MLHELKPAILLVEDNFADARLFQIAAAEEGIDFTCIHVTDGDAAMAALRGDSEHPVPDLVLLDLNLPRKDGLTVLEEVKANPRFQRIPVLVLSTSSREEEIAECYRRFANCYIKKARTFDEMRVLVSTLFRHWFGIARLAPADPPRFEADEMRVH